MSQINYDFLIKQIQRDLPTLPTIVNELTTILENPNSSTMIVEDIVTADQCMASKILRVANTSLFRAGGDRVSDVNQAIGNVGFDKVKDVVLNNSVFKLFKNDKKDKYWIVFHDNWLDLQEHRKCFLRYLKYQADT